MTYEEFLQLTKEEQLQILNEYAQYNFHEGETNACDFEYGRNSNAYWCEFEGYLKTIKK